MPHPGEIDPRRTARRPLSLRLQVALLLAFATLPVGVIAVAQGYAAFSDSEELRRVTLASEAFKQTTREQGLIRETLGALDALRSQVDVDLPVGECSARMRALVDQKGQFIFAGIVGADGVMRCGHPLRAPLDLRGSPEYADFVANPRRTVTVYQQGAISKRSVVTVSIPVMRAGDLVGAIAISLPSTYMAWANAPERDSASRFAILDSKGRTVAQSGKRVATDWLPDPAEVPAMLAGSRGPVMATASTGETRLYAVTPLFKRDIFAVSSWPKGQASWLLNLPQLLTLLLPLVMWALAVTVAYFAVDRFALRHVVYLDRLVSAYARSGRSLRASGMREAPLEFAALGESFDRMAQQIENREDELYHSLDEKDALLKEVYHRVGNNLQMIVSLMNLQLRTTRGEQERETLQRLQDRVLGLAAVHKRLSEAGQVNAIRIDTLLAEIATNAREARESKPGEVALVADMIDHVEGPDRALPLALFTAEAVANAFKHGLEEHGGGTLSLILRETGTSTLELVISNSRAGGALDSDGLGSQLIDSFARQLRGEVERSVTPDRFTLSLTFPCIQPQGAGQGLTMNTAPSAPKTTRKWAL